MKYNSISTNIVRDSGKDLDYVVTPNTKEIFDRIFLRDVGANRSFNLIGNYGTGKSTFLWALEKNLNQEKFFFNNLSTLQKHELEFDFFKIIGENNSLYDSLKKNLRLKGEVDDAKILHALETRRLKAIKKGKGFILIIDEFGKFLEYASKNNTTDELFLIQQISEWVNDDQKNTFFIITLHQNFGNYGVDLSSKDRLEWEKIKGRFIDLVFNEPVEQLIYFASKKLKELIIPSVLNEKFYDLYDLIKESNLVSYNNLTSKELSNSLYPLDWLSANILVKSLQRYGQNERSLFSFLNDSSEHSIHKTQNNFYSVSNVYDYLLSALPSEINSSNNPHRAQWLTTFRALERAELIFDEDYPLASEVIKTIGLINIFTKTGGLFNGEFLCNYFTLTRETDVTSIIKKLEKSGVIRFYRHSNKINFLEGTDIDLEQELISVSKEINSNFSIVNEIKSLIDLPIIMVKRYSFETGTKRFFEYKLFESFDEIKSPENVIDGQINLVFESLAKTLIKKNSKHYKSSIFVLYKNSTLIRNEVEMILKFNKLIEHHKDDINALKLLNSERNFHLDKLENLVINNLFNNEKNIWINNGQSKTINNKHELYEWLTEICYNVYSKTPEFNNELINREFLSSPINTARKYLFRSILENEHLNNLGFDPTKFPPQKAIYISLLKKSGIHQENKNLGYYELNSPPKNSKLYNLWQASEDFLNTTLSNKRKVSEFYELILEPPFKLKKGFVDFWIPIFLIAKKEDYALFHEDSGFIPFISDDTLDLIHKKPEKFLLKSYDVSGLKINLIESYKELVQLGGSNSKGTQSTFLSIFGNFLRFQRGLNQYTLKTQKLSSRALKLREAIVKSKDPEDALFNQFPSALGFHSISIKEDEEVLHSFTKHIQDAIREIREAYGELLNRTEEQIIKSLYCESSDFHQYKSEIIEKLKSINPNVLGKTQNIFYRRLISPLDDRVSWIKSVADVALGSSLENILDEEEPLLINNIKDLSLGLIKAAEIGNFNKNSEKGKLYSIRFFGESGEYIDDKLVINGESSKKLSNIKTEISYKINDLTSKERKELLIELLSKEMDI